MRRPTIYLDTTIPSFLVGNRRNPVQQGWHLTTLTWWEHERSAYDLFISEVVLEELDTGNPTFAKERRQAVEALPRLPLTEPVQKAAQYYIEQTAMPQNDYRDAFHLALASVHAVDYLLTWNFAHLANADKRRHLEVLNRRLKLPLPVICAPLELLHSQP